MRLMRLAQTRRSAFTLLEALIVVTVIALLTAISLTVAVRAHSSGKARATENVLKALDVLITEYSATKGGKIPQYVTDDNGISYPMVDGWAGLTDAADPPNKLPQPSLSIFLLEAQRIHLTSKMLQGVDSEFIKRGPIIAHGWGAGSATIGVFDGIQIFDGFGNPIRLVHPSFHGGYGTYYKEDGAAGDFTAEGTRANLIVRGPNGEDPIEFNRSCLPEPYRYGDRVIPQGHSDEGRCVANRPYVYSAGIDGNPGTRMDNFYVGTKPQWPAETATIFLNTP